MAKWFAKKPAQLVDNKKTYIIVIAAMVLGVLQGAGLFQVPELVWQIMPLLGLGALRHGVSKAKAAYTETLKEMNK